MKIFNWFLNSKITPIFVGILIYFAIFMIITLTFTAFDYYIVPLIRAY